MQQCRWCLRIHSIYYSVLNLRNNSIASSLLCDFLEANIFSLCHFITLIWISTNQMVLRMIREKLTQGLKKNNLNWNQPKLVACQHEFFLTKVIVGEHETLSSVKKFFLFCFYFLLTIVSIRNRRVGSYTSLTIIILIIN